jgi:hypothetical protein
LDFYASFDWKPQEVDSLYRFYPDVGILYPIQMMRLEESSLSEVTDQGKNYA